MKPRWSYLAAIAAVTLLLAAAPLFQTSAHSNIAMLERLAPRIERAQMLAPETTEVIMGLLERVSQSVSDARYEIRRQAAINRITAALKAKSGAPELSNVGQRQAD